MNNMLNLPPIPTSILGLSNIEIEDAAMDSVGDFIIKVKSIDKTIKCKKCGDITSPHGYNRRIRLRHLPVFGHKTYIETAPARGVCNKCDNHLTTTVNQVIGMMLAAAIQKLRKNTLYYP